MLRPLLARVSVLSLLLSAGACEKGSTTNPSDPTAASDPSATDASASSDAGSEDPGVASGDTSSTSEPEAPPKRERIRIHNSCSKQVNLRIERVNDSDTNTTLTSNTGMEERASDGDEVRLLDDKYNVVHAVTIEAAMTEVDIASSCTEIHGK